MMTVARVAFAIWAVPGSAWASYDVASKLLSSLMHNVAEAKEAEDLQKNLTIGQPPKALSPPRKNEALIDRDGPDDLEDEIPF